MKKILLIHSGKANLPELTIYPQYFPAYKFYNCEDYPSCKINEFDLIWYFMGLNLKRENIPVVHEYASLSVGHGAVLKDQIKRRFNITPNLRIFLNANIKDHYGFSDAVPYVYRDMGVASSFFHRGKGHKLYDVVYVGSMDKGRNLTRMLDWFAQNRELSILLVGAVDDKMYCPYRGYSNIAFTGKIPYQDVVSTASMAQYAINYIPNKYPYCYQTSTKLLEYIAMGLNVITTRYAWVNTFECERKMRFFKVSEDLHELSRAALESYDFVNQDISDLQWEQVIRRSGLESALVKLLGAT